LRPTQSARAQADGDGEAERAAEASSQLSFDELYSDFNK
jgi:hypothetical protein